MTPPDLTPEQVTAAADYQLTEGDRWSVATVPVEEAVVWIDSAHASLAAAISHAEEAR